MIGSWWKNRNELLVITACSATFGAVMLELGIFGAECRLRAVRAETTSEENRMVTAPDGSSYYMGRHFLSSSPEEDALKESEYEHRQYVLQARRLRDLLIRKLMEQEASNRKAKDENEVDLGSSG